MLLFTSLRRYCCLVRTWWMCANKSRHTHISFLARSAFASCITANPYAVMMNSQLAIRYEGSVDREERLGKARRCLPGAQIWPYCPQTLNSSMWPILGMDCRLAGLRAAVALTTYSNEAGESTNTESTSFLSAQNTSLFLPLFSFHHLSHFFPYPASQSLFLSSISSFYSLTHSLEQNPTNGTLLMSRLP